MLVLKHKNTQSSARKVVIPYGKVIYHNPDANKHTQVFIDTKELKEITYFIYDIDTLLRRLKGNNSLTSRLYKAYLHAITTHVLPDPFTGLTGTEQALYDLRSAGTRSFQTLLPLDIELLKAIAQLTPPRSYYPGKYQHAQHVSWNVLPSMAQHEEFYRIAMDIIKYNTQQNSLFGTDKESQVPAIEIKMCGHLLNRSSYRNSAFRAEEFGDLALERKDLEYKSRDLDRNCTDPEGGIEAKVFSVAESLESWTLPKYCQKSFLNELRTWDANNEHINGYDPLSLINEFGFSSSWLSMNMATDFWTIFGACRKVEKKDRHGLMFFAATLVFSGKVTLKFVNMILSFAMMQKFSDLEFNREAPDIIHYLSHGYKTDRIWIDKFSDSGL